MAAPAIPCASLDYLLPEEAAAAKQEYLEGRTVVALAGATEEHKGTRNIDKGCKFFNYRQIPSLQECIHIDSEQYVLLINVSHPAHWNEPF